MPGLKVGREARLKLISTLEKKFESVVLVYFTADAPIVGGRIGEDAPRTMFDHLRAFGKQNRLALFLYSPGGVMETPWKIVAMLREFCKEFYVIVPYKAYSAATMIALGADKIYMTRKAELGPIDPSLEAVVPKTGPGPALPNLGVEDISAYIAFMRKRVGLSDQTALASAATALAQHLTPPLLGRLERIYSHIRLVARNLLSLHNPPLDDRQISSITEALTEKLYVHGHGIGRKEATSLGLDVKSLDEKEEEAVWALYEAYEPVFRLRERQDVESYFPDNSDEYVRAETAVACIESSKKLHAFTGKIRAKRMRQLPQNPTINVNLQLQLPAQIQAQQIPAALQQTIQQLLQQGLQKINAIVADEIRRQAPVIGATASLEGGIWEELT